MSNPSYRNNIYSKPFALKTKIKNVDHITMKNRESTCRSQPQVPAILPFPRSKNDAKRFYDHISRFYDYLTGRFERKHAETALGLLSLGKGETVLEIGFGTGHCLKRIAEIADETNEVGGIEISSGMLEATKRRLDKDGHARKVELCQGDAGSLPYRDAAFNVVFMSFILELFDTPEIPKILHEIKRVLKAGGRLGVVSMSREDGQSLLLRLYEWTHKKWPRYVDCRPIYLELSLTEAGYQIARKRKETLFGIPLEIIVALNSE